jgi:putative ABC transport system substrate-binding protein
MQRILAVAVGATPERGASGVLRNIIAGRRVEELRPYVAGLISGLEKLGFRRGQDFEIDSATCEPKGLRTLVKTAVDEDRADAIFAMSTSAVKAAMAVCKDIPIIFPSVSDPADDGVVKSCAAPGRNATGVRAMRRQTADECLELFKATVPSLRKVFGLHKPNYFPATRPTARLKLAAKRARVTFKAVEVRSHKEIADTLGAMSQTGAAGKPELGVLVLPDDLVLSAARDVTRLAQEKRLPTFFPATDWVRESLPSALAGFGVPQFVCGEAAAPYMLKVLKGVLPKDLPVKRIGGFEWAVSKAAADAIGVTIPESVVTAADRVVG